MNTVSKFALITGASSGIGKAFAYYCGSKKMDLLLISLPNEGLENIAKDISATHGVIVHFFETDLASDNGPLSVFNWVSSNKYPVNILINNAGVAGTAVFEKASPEYSHTRIMVNIRALVLLTSYFIPELQKHEKSHILNVGSLSAFFSIPYKSVYSASKAFVVSFSRSLRYELKHSSIKVSVVCPNGVRTNAETHARINAHGFMGRITAIPVEKLAEKSIENMLKGKFLYIPLGINRVLLFIQKIIPVAMQQRILTREFNKEVKVS